MLHCYYQYVKQSHKYGIGRALWAAWTLFAITCFSPLILQLRKGTLTCSKLTIRKCWEPNLPPRSRYTLHITSPQSRHRPLWHLVKQPLHMEGCVLLTRMKQTLSLPPDAYNPAHNSHKEIDQSVMSVQIRRVGWEWLIPSGASCS